MKYLLAIVLSLILFFPFYYSLTYLPTTKKYTFFDKFSIEELDIYTFEKVGKYYSIGLELESGLEKNIVDSVYIKETDGSKDNILKVAANRNSIAFCQSDVYFKYIDSVFVSGNDTVVIRDNVTIVDELYTEKLHIITECPNNGDCSGIGTITGTLEVDSSLLPILQSSNIGERNSGTRVTMLTLIELLNQVWGGHKKIDVSKLDTMKVYNSLIKLSCNNLLSTALVTSEGNSYINEHIDRGISTFLGISENLIDSLNNKIPGNEKYKAYKADYIGEYNPKIPTVGVRTFLISNTKLARQVVDASTNYINNNSDKNKTLSIIERDLKNGSTCEYAKLNVKPIYKYFLLSLVFLVSAALPIIMLMLDYITTKKIKKLKNELGFSKSQSLQNTPFDEEARKVNLNIYNEKEQNYKISINKGDIKPHRENSLSITKLDKHQMDYITLEIYVKDKIFRTDENGKILPAIFEIRKKPKGLITLIVYAHATKIDKPILSGSKKWVDPDVVANHKEYIKSLLKARYKKKSKDLISINNDDLFIINGDKHKLIFNNENIKIDNDLLKLEEIKNFLKEYPKLKKALTIQNWNIKTILVLKMV